LAAASILPPTPKIENAIFGIDPKTPRELFEARNAVRIARNASGGKYGPYHFRQG